MSSASTDATPTPPDPTEALRERRALMVDCTKLLDALEDLDEMTSREMQEVYDKEEAEIIPLEDHIVRLQKLRALLNSRLREVEAEDLDGHAWPGAC